MAKQKTKMVTKSDDGNYRIVEKSKFSPRKESSSMKVTRTLKGVLRGAPRVPGGPIVTPNSSNRYEGREREGASEGSSLYMNKKGGSVKSKKKK